MLSNAHALGIRFRQMNATDVVDSLGVKAFIWSGSHAYSAFAWSTPYYNASGLLLQVALPVAGQVWTSNGATSAPGWSAAGSGDVTKAGNNAMTGDNTHAGTETFNGPVVMDSTVTMGAIEKADGDTINVAKQLQVPFDESADATLTTDGSVHVRGDEKRFSADLGAAGEATISFLTPISVICDPGAWYDSNTTIFLFKVGDEAPNGIKIQKWRVSCNVDPDVEMDLDLKRATAWIGLGGAAVMDILDTTNGVSSESTAANINGGAVVANGQAVYLSFGADPEGTGTQLIFEMEYLTEED